MKYIINKGWKLIEKVLIFVLTRFWRMDPESDKLRGIIQFVKFGLVGVSSTVVLYTVYMICIMLKLHYFIANIIAFVASVLNSFFWNSQYVFADDNKKGYQSSVCWYVVLARTFAAYSFTGFFLNSFLLFLEIDIIGISEKIAPMINVFITLPINYFMNKKWAYKK